MSETYSIYISQPTESTSYTDVDYILSLLPDNLEKEVNPKDIRDGILSTWDVPSFKETTTTSSNISYIGIDTGNTASYRDNKLKIYFGKREINGSHIMSNSLLSNDVDIFFHNTKIDSLSQNRTRLSFLSGINESKYGSSPYIQSQISSGTAGQVLTSDIVNQSGDIKISSSFEKVTLNSTSFPKISETSISASMSRVLRSDNGNLYWDDISVILPSTVGVTGSELNIFGTPVLVNGHPIEFTDVRETPIDFYGMKQGRSFNNTPIVEIIREILYPYLLPTCSLSINQSIAEFGTFPTIYLNYSVTKRTFNLNTTTLTNMIPGSLSPIISTGQVTVSGTANGVYISNTDTSFQIMVNDGTQSVSASQSLYFVFPYFHGLLANPSIDFAGLSTLDKTIDDQNDLVISLIGSGYIYFIYDNDYSNLSQILDENDIDITSSFTYSISTLTSPSWLWASHQFKVYRSLTSSYSFTPPSSNYKFKF